MAWHTVPDFNGTRRVRPLVEWRSTLDMQKHEGPRRDYDREERDRQRALTKSLLLAVLLLAGMLAAMLYDRWA
jgi:hypothetical protein